MKKAVVERNIAVVLFILVLVVFSFAERDTRKIKQLYLNSDNSPSAIFRQQQDSVITPFIRPRVSYSLRN